MKKHIVTFLIVSAFAGASAQSYTQAFDSVFQHVDISHTSTGILYERVLPDKRPTHFTFSFRQKELSTNKQQYKYEKDSVYHD